MRQWRYISIENPNDIYFIVPRNMCKTTNIWYIYIYRYLKSNCVIVVASRSSLTEPTWMFKHIHTTEYYQFCQPEFSLMREKYHPETSRALFKLTAEKSPQKKNPNYRLSARRSRRAGGFVVQRAGNTESVLMGLHPHERAIPEDFTPSARTG